MLSGDVDNNVSTGGGFFRAVVKKTCFYCKQRERPNIATGLHLRTVVLYIMQSACTLKIANWGDIIHNFYTLKWN